MSGATQEDVLEDPITLDFGAMELFEQWRVAKDVLSRWSLVEKDLKAKLLDSLDGHKVALFEGEPVFALVVHPDSYRVDTQLLRRRYPDIFAEVNGSVTKGFRTIRAVRR